MGTARAERAHHTRRQNPPVFLAKVVVYYFSVFFLDFATFTRTVPVVQKAALGPKTKYRTCALWLFSHSTKAESAGRLDRGQWPRSTLPGCSVHTAAMQPCPSSSPLSPGRSTQPRAPAAAPRRRALSRAGRAPPPASPRAAASSSATPPCVPAHRTRTVAARQGWRGGRDAGGVPRRPLAPRVRPAPRGST